MELARRGTSANPSAVAVMSLRMYVEPTSITHALIEALRQHGYRDREIADVAGVVDVVALNVLNGAFNLAAGLRPETNDQMS